MYEAEPLVQDWRGGLVENVHHGYLCAVDEDSKVIFSQGDPDTYIFYRSASKPIQALPVMALGLDKKYGLTPEETVIFSGSHAAEERHVAVLESILHKTGLSEDDLIVKPTAPGNQAAAERCVREGMPYRKLFHNCAGKHLACMMLQRELGGAVADYWRPESPAQNEILRTVAVLSEVKPETVKLGVDGCGVPVFAVPVHKVAAAYKNLAWPEKIADDKLREVTAAYVPLISQYPLMMRGTGFLCTEINLDDNLVAKGGAEGAYGCGLKRERTGIAMKLQDGTEAAWPLLLRGVFARLGYQNPQTDATLEKLGPVDVYNTLGNQVGRHELLFAQL